MRNTWDRFAKEVLPTVLAGVGHVDTAVEAEADAQQIDVVVLPEPGVDWDVAFRTLGWVTRMAERPAIIEPYSTTVGVDDVRECLRKQLTLAHVWKKAAGRRSEPPSGKSASGKPASGKPASESQGPVEVEVPRLWLLSAGDARGATEGFGLEQREEWPIGFRFAAPGLALCVVVLSDLPRTRETLALRLLGRGKTLAEAVQDVRELGEDDPLRRPLMEILAQRRFAALNSTDDEDLAEAAMLQHEWQKYKDQIRAEGREEGLRTAISAIEALCDVLGIELTPSRRSVLAAMGTPELTELLDTLRQRRRWPEH